MNLEDISGTIERLKAFEKNVAISFKEGKVKGASHFSSGNEVQLIKLFRGLRTGDYVYHSQLHYNRQELIDRGLIEIPVGLSEDHALFRGIREEDWLFLSYRNHYHCLLKGVPEAWLEEKIVDGWSMTPINLDKKIIASGIVPGQIPIALGLAMAFKLKGLHNHVWTFCGDMGAETGIFYECAKYADNHSLPMTFVIEDNGLSVETPTENVWGAYNNSLRKNTIRYRYKSGVPHQGVGKEVGF